MERTIGNLGEEIKQPSNPYVNLSERGSKRAQINAIYAMYPELDPTAEEKLPAGACDLGGSYVLLHACDRHPKIINGPVRPSANLLLH